MGAVMLDHVLSHLEFQIGYDGLVILRGGINDIEAMYKVYMDGDDINRTPWFFLTDMNTPS